MEFAFEISRMMKIVLFSTAYAMLYSLVLVWMLERKERRYKLGKFSFGEGLFSAALTLLAVYISVIIVFLRWPGRGPGYSAALFLCLLVFCVFRERSYRAGRALMEKERREEIALLTARIHAEPGNASYFERLSEIYEGMGNRELALEKAREAARISPSVGAAWRVKQLEKN